MRGYSAYAKVTFFHEMVEFIDYLLRTKPIFSNLSYFNNELISRLEMHGRKTLSTKFCP